jgi:hypothetical protein
MINDLERLKRVIEREKKDILSSKKDISYKIGRLLAEHDSAVCKLNKEATLLEHYNLKQNVIENIQPQDYMIEYFDKFHLNNKREEVEYKTSMLTMDICLGYLSEKLDVNTYVTILEILKGRE